MDKLKLIRSSLIVEILERLIEASAEFGTGQIKILPFPPPNNENNSPEGDSQS